MGAACRSRLGRWLRWHNRLGVIAVLRSGTGMIVRPEEMLALALPDEAFA